MKTLIAIALMLMFATTAYCDIKYIGGYDRKDGTYVSGHYRDTSNDGQSWNNANTLGYNGHRRSPRGIYGDY